MTDKRPLIGITMGDPAGIGPETLVSAFSEPSLFEICRPIVIGDTTVMQAAVHLKQSEIWLQETKSPDKGIYSFGCMDILPMSRLSEKDIKPACPTSETGKAMIDYITTAVDLSKGKKIAAMVTCPITKTAMKLAGSAFHGHTELIAHRTRTDEFSMMLAGATLKVVLVTIHIPLSEVATQISTEKILKTIRITGKALKERFGILKPQIAVAGLNPHAGEDTLFGPEERDIIAPAVSQAEKEGFNVTGPLPPDTLFYHAVNGRYDCVVCMYHDQGLIPFKMIHFSDGVNTTLGLPIIRTSVDHGTAYDIAWQGQADHSSLRAAIEMAVLQSKTAIRQTADPQNR